MSADPTKAVFLSYASQDADAARRICDALRAAGVEVWFDQSELRGGDAWDQKIKRQIKECALFLPVISANTNTRTEGYFRLEWLLAVERSRLMAEDAPFLVPVLIDDTTDAIARVPDKFRDVQWTRLPAGEAPAAFCERVQSLLSGSNLEAGRPRPAQRAAGVASPAPSRRVGRAFRARHWWIGGAATAIIAFLSLKKNEPPASPPNAGPGSAPSLSKWPRPPTTEKPAAPSSEAAQQARRAIAMTTKLNFSRDELAVAAELARKATELDAGLALAWGARARVETAWMHRNWDVGQARRQAALDFAKRAVALDPEEPNALWTQGMVFREQQAFAEAIALFLRALAVNPDDNYIRRALAGAFRTQGRDTEAVTAYEECLRRNPRDPLAYYSLSLTYTNNTSVKDNDLANVDIALRNLDQALAIQPFSTALVQKAALLAAWKGNFPAARATLDRLAELPLTERTEDRPIFFLMWIALLEKSPQRALTASALTTSTYFEDAIVAEPVAWMKAFAHHSAGRDNLAEEEWRAAEVVVRSRLAASPNSLVTQAELAVTLAHLGRKEEAAQQFARYEAAMRERRREATPLHAVYYAAMGEVAKAVKVLAQARKNMVIWATDHTLPRDPRWALLRGTPEFVALLAEAKK